MSCCLLFSPLLPYSPSLSLCVSVRCCGYLLPDCSGKKWDSVLAPCVSKLHACSIYCTNTNSLFEGGAYQKNSWLIKIMAAIFKSVPKGDFPQIMSTILVVLSTWFPQICLFSFFLLVFCFVGLLVIVSHCWLWIKLVYVSTVDCNWPVLCEYFAHQIL